MLLKSIYPLCLPAKPNPDPNHMNKNFGSVVGFGPKDDGSKTMNQLGQKVRSHNFCKKRYKPSNVDFDFRELLLEEFPNSFDDSLICAQNT